MTIDEAINILSWEDSQFPKGTNPEFTDALELGIEALKHIQADRQSPYCIMNTSLPGETEE